MTISSPVGTVTTDGAWQLHTFTESGLLVAEIDVECFWWVVAGGGGWKLGL